LSELPEDWLRARIGISPETIPHEVVDRGQRKRDRLREGGALDQDTKNQHVWQPDRSNEQIKHTEIDDEAGDTDGQNLAKRLNSLRLVLASVMSCDMAF